MSKFSKNRNYLFKTKITTKTNSKIMQLTQKRVNQTSVIPHT